MRIRTKTTTAVTLTRDEHLAAICEHADLDPAAVVDWRIEAESDAVRVTLEMSPDSYQLGYVTGDTGTDRPAELVARLVE